MRSFEYNQNSTLLFEIKTKRKLRNTIWIQTEMIQNGKYEIAICWQQMQTRAILSSIVCYALVFFFVYIVRSIFLFNFCTRPIAETSCNVKQKKKKKKYIPLKQK